MAARNPFPGMNPYLEQRWGDVHGSLTTYARDLIQDLLPGDLRARMEERVFIESPSGPGASYYPDVQVTELPGGRPGMPVTQGAGAAVAEPLILHIPPIERHETFIQIIDPKSGGRVITMIEFLSPSNKRPGQGRNEYVRKQGEARQARVNLVEIDLLRGGMWTTLAPWAAVPKDQFAPYHVTVCRATRPDHVEYYPLPLREPLPAVRIPLRPTDPDVALDLQALVDLAYQRGRYDDIDYRQPSVPPLDPEDAAWADQLLKAKGLR